jgi:hypothetical protein
VIEALCSVCHVPESDAFLCPTCTAHLHTWLVELAGHAVDLEDVVVPRMTSRRGERVMVTGTTETPLIVDLDASEAAWELHSDLVAIVRDLCESRGITYPGVDRSAALAAWLGRNVASIALDPAALEIFDIVRHRLGETRRVVDIAPAKVWLGRCDAMVDGAVCGQDVRAAEGATVVRCKGCMSVIDVAEFRARMLERSRDGAVPFPELVLIFRGVVRPNLLAVWRNRGRLRPVDPDGAEPLYRVGEVMDMVEALRARKDEAA